MKKVHDLIAGEDRPEKIIVHVPACESIAMDPQQFAQPGCVPSIGLALRDCSAGFEEEDEQALE